jgi:hypothetical protein
VAARPRSARSGYRVRLATWWLWVLFYLADAAAGMAVSAWAFVSGQWIIGVVAAGWTLWWTVVLFRELELARAARRLLRL